MNLNQRAYYATSYVHGRFLKPWVSRLVAAWLGLPRAELAALVSAEEVAKALWTNWTYKHDPWKGRGDLYTPAEVLQAAMNEGPAAVAALATGADCDDLALYAARILSAVPGYRARIVIILDNAFGWSRRESMTHAVCVFTDEQGRAGAIDTSSVAIQDWPDWSLRAGVVWLADDRLETVMAAYNRIYQAADYFAAYELPTPRL